MMLGPDGQAHWFGEHEDWVLKERTIENVFLPAFVGMAKQLRKLGVEVINATPGSALNVFPKAKLEAVI